MAVSSPALFPPTPGASAGTLAIQWITPSGSLDGYELEEKLGVAGTYQQVHTGLLPSTATSYEVTLPAGAAETLDVFFRIRATRGGDRSAYSNEVLYHKPLNAPGQLVGHYDWTASGVALTWAGNSTLADGVVLKRAECTSGGTVTGAWVTVDGPSGTAGAFLDTGAKLDLYYVYVVANLKGKEISADSPVSGVISTFVPAPSLLTAVYDAARGGVSLTCTDAFSQADGVILERAEANGGGLAVGPWVTLSTPPGALATFLDTSALEGTNYLYRISNLRQASGSAAVLSSATVLVPPAAPSALTAQYDVVQGAVLLSWTGNSTHNTGVQLERTEADANGAAINPWVTLAVPAGPMLTFSDRGTQEFTRYIYRATNLLGASKSALSNTSTSVSTPLSAPTILSAAYDPAKGGVSLTWKTNSTHTDGAIVERATCDANGYLTSTWSNLYSYGAKTAYVDTGAAELSRFLYRVTNLNGSVPSSPSVPSAPVGTPLAAPSYLSASYYSYYSGIYVSWNGSNRPGRTTKLERAESNAAGTPTGAWTAITLGSNSQTSYTDAGLKESTYYLYRVAYTLDQYTTPYAQTTSPVLTPLLAPTQVVATGRSGGVDLSWQNQSLAASQVLVRRTVGYTTVTVATLPSSATTYSDTGLQLGTYGYAIVAKNSYGETPSPSVSGTTLNRADSLVLTSATLSRSGATDAALRPLGTWAFASQSPFEILSNGDPWVAIYPNTTTTLGKSLIKMDGLDHPHSVFLVPSLTDPAVSILRHLWHDGTSWNTEDMMQGPFPTYAYSLPYFQFVLDSAGRPQALVNLSVPGNSYGGTVDSLAYVHYSAGSWQTTPLSTASNATKAVSAYSLALDGADLPHILVQIGSDGVELLPGTPGQWTVNKVTTEALSTAYGTPFLDAVWQDSDNGWLFYLVSTTSSPYSASLKAQQKVGGVWQAPTVVGTQEVDYGNATALAGASSDHSKVALLFSTNVGLKAYRHDLSGWHETLVDPSTSNSSRWYRIGFDSSNKLNVLIRSQSDYTTYTALHE